MGRNKYFLGKGPWPGGWGPFPVRFIERGDAGLPAAMHPYSGAGNAALAEAMRPPFSFRSCRKENGPRPVQKKRTLRRVGPRRRVPPAAGGGWLAVSRGNRHETRRPCGCCLPGEGPDTGSSSFRWRWPGGCWALCRQGNKRAGADWFRLCSFSFIPQTAWRRESPRPPRCGRAYTGMGRGCGRYCWTPADR